MKSRFIIFLVAFIFIYGTVSNTSAQVDSVIGQVSASSGNSFAGGMSGDGRLIVFESNGDAATENPRNSDRSREIFVFDYAQRRIFQITDTKVVRNSPRSPVTSSINTRIDIVSIRPVISNDGKFLAFSSNATSSVPGDPVDGTNPGNFDGNSFTNATAGADQLDLFDAEDGVTLANLVQPTAPDTVRINIIDLNSSITAFSVTVAGTDTGGASISETFSFDDGLTQVGTLTFATITSVTLDSIIGNDTFDSLDFEYGDGSNVLTTDANVEMWLFEFQNALTPVDLSQGNEVPYTDLSTGTFTQITNTPASRLPVSGGVTQPPIIANDNSDASISDNGNVTAFVSNQNLSGTGNEAPDDNPEIFTYIHNSSSIGQVTQTPPGEIFLPLTNNSPTISGNGMRVSFASNADNPIAGMTGGDNTDSNEEVFYADLTAAGVPSGNNKQLTTTGPTNPGELVNRYNFGRRMSRDGRYIAFDSYADLTNENSGENQDGFATFLYDANTDDFRRLAARSDADDAAPGGDLSRYPTFTDYVGGSPQTVVMETRMNISPEGIIPTDEEDGLNNIIERPAQVYSYPINETAENTIFTRITNLPPPTIFVLASIQIYTSNTLERTAFTIPISEIGTGNPDFSDEVYYLLKPEVITDTASAATFATGATNFPVSNDPPPSPTPTPTATPTPTPQTPATIQGLSPGMLAKVNFTTGVNQPATAVTAVGSIDRRFQLPMELGGVTMTIGGVTVGLKRVSRRQITFVVPDGLATGFEEPFDVVINNNGVIIRGDIVIVAARPDIFRREDAPSGSNRAKIFNVTNRVFTREPFDVRTLKYRGGVKVPTVLRLYITGVRNVSGSQTVINIGGESVQATIGDPQFVEPGIYTIDIELSPNLEMVGDQGIVISVLVGDQIFGGRLGDTAPRVSIL